MIDTTTSRIGIEVDFNSNDFNRNIRNLQSEVNLAETKFKSASSALKNLGHSNEMAAAQQQALSKKIEAQNLQLKNYDSIMQKNNEKIKEGIKQRDKLKESLDSANKSYKDSVKLYGKESDEAKKAKDDVEKLTTQYNKKEKALENVQRNMNKYQQKMEGLKTSVLEGEVALKNINKELDKNNNKWLNSSKKLNDASEKMHTVGGIASKTGDSILKLTAPLAAAGVASTKLGTDFNEAMSKVATLIPGQRERLLELKGDVQNVAIATAKGTDDIADGTYQVISAFGDASDTMQKVEIDAKAATAGMATTTDALNLSSAVMKGYGDTSAEANQKIMDMSFNVVKLGQTDFASLAASIGKVVPLSNELKITQEEMFNVFATGTGVTGTASEVATQYRGILQSLMAPTKSMTTLISEMGYTDGKAMIEQKGLAGTIELITNKAKETNTPLQQYIGSIEGQTLALALAGEQSQVYKDKLEQMKKSSGALDEAFNEQSNGINKTGFAYKQAIVKMQVAAQKMGDALAPVLEKGAELFTNLADKLSGMNKEQLESIAKWGMFSIATGGALKIVGGGISTVANITGGLGKLAGALGVGKTATSGIAGAMGTAGTSAGGLGKAIFSCSKLLNPWTLAIVGGGAAALGLGKVLRNDVVKDVDLLGSKTEIVAKKITDSSGQVRTTYETVQKEVSKTTKEAVGAYATLEEEATKKLTTLYSNSTKITAQQTQEVSNLYNQMEEKILQGMDTKNSEKLSAMESLFANMKGKEKSNSADILNNIKVANEEEKEEIKQKTNRILEIYDSATKEHRELKKDEINEINKLNGEMKETAIEVLSESAQDQRLILENLKQSTERISAENASEIIQKAEETKNGTIAEAEEQYEEVVKNIISLRDDSGKISAEEADMLIKEAKRQKDETVQKAEEMKKETVQKVGDMCDDMEKKVDTSTGNILSFWDKIVSFIFPKKTIEVEYSSPGNSDSERWTPKKDSPENHNRPNSRGRRSLAFDEVDSIKNRELASQMPPIYSSNIDSNNSNANLEKVINSALQNMRSDINVTQHIYATTNDVFETQRQAKNNFREFALNF